MEANNNGNFTCMAFEEITRRALAATLAAPLLAAAAKPSRVIDVATHFYDTNRPQGVPWPPATQPVLYKPSFPSRYLAAVKPYNVDAVVAIEASPWLEDNLWLLTVADHDPLIRAVVGNIPPGHPDFQSALERFAKHPLFRGIRIGGAVVEGILADPKRLADIAFLAERGLSLDILVSTPPQFSHVAKLAGLLPRLPIIVGHMPNDDSRGMNELARLPFVSAKVSGVIRKVNGTVPREASFYKRGLDELWDVFGPERLMFASNWPTCDMIALYPVVFEVVAEYLTRRPAAEVEAFFWRNAQKVYRLAV